MTNRAVPLCDTNSRSQKLSNCPSDSIANEGDAPPVLRRPVHLVALLPVVEDHELPPLFFASKHGEEDATVSRRSAQKVVVLPDVENGELPRTFFASTHRQPDQSTPPAGSEEDEDNPVPSNSEDEGPPVDTRGLEGKSSKRRRRGHQETEAIDPQFSDPDIVRLQQSTPLRRPLLIKSFLGSCIPCLCWESKGEVEPIVSISPSNAIVVMLAFGRASCSCNAQILPTDQGNCRWLWLLVRRRRRRRVHSRRDFV